MSSYGANCEARGMVQWSPSFGFGKYTLILPVSAHCRRRMRRYSHLDIQRGIIVGVIVGSMGGSCNYWRKLDSFDWLGEILEWLRKVNTFLVWIAMKILVHIVIHLPHYWSATPAAFAWWSSDYAREKTSIARGPGNERKMMFWRIAWDISVSSVTHEMKARRTGDSFLEILELCQSIILLSALCSDIDARDFWMNKKSKPWPWEFVG